MKINRLICTLALGSSLLFATNAVGQERSLMTKAEHERMDSLSVAFKKTQAKEQKDRDAKTMSDLKSGQNATKATAKEAARVEQDASDAAKESRNAYRTEKKAQKARKHADAQAKKAARAKDKSDDN
jgi:hypothetical protein